MCAKMKHITYSGIKLGATNVRENRNVDRKTNSKRKRNIQQRAHLWRSVISTQSLHASAIERDLRAAERERQKHECADEFADEGGRFGAVAVRVQDGFAFLAGRGCGSGLGVREAGLGVLVGAVGRHGWEDGVAYGATIQVRKVNSRISNVRRDGSALDFLDKTRSRIPCYMFRGRSMEIAFLVYDTHHPNITVHSWRDRTMVLTGPIAASQVRYSTAPIAYQLWRPGCVDRRGSERSESSVHSAQYDKARHAFGGSVLGVMTEGGPVMRMIDDLYY
jgi:hypothetical protein